jgi:hypothetical protein
MLDGVSRHAFVLRSVPYKNWRKKAVETPQFQSQFYRK